MGEIGVEADTADVNLLWRRAGEAVRRSRQCPSWYPYAPGFDPMEHFRWFQEETRERE